MVPRGFPRQAYSLALALAAAARLQGTAGVVLHQGDGDNHAGVGSLVEEPPTIKVEEAVPAYEVARLDRDLSKVQPRKRVAWFHPPKCGSSFGATVLHYANESLPEKEGPELLASWMPFFYKYPYKKWFQDVFWKPQYDHKKIDLEAYEEYKGDWVGIFRIPEQRLISSYMDKAGSQGPLDAYARMASGTMVRELAGQEDGDKRACWPDTEGTRANCGGRGALPGETPEEPNVELALKRLKEGFKFVGLTEEYDLSVCLFHSMFGGQCLPVEFKHMRRSGPQTRTGTTVHHNDDRLNGYKDPWDGQLYAAAKERFWADAALYGINRTFCKTVCSRASSVFDPRPEPPNDVAKLGPPKRHSQDKPGGQPHKEKKEKKDKKDPIGDFFRNVLGVNMEQDSSATNYSFAPAEMDLSDNVAALSLDMDSSYAFDWPGRLVLDEDDIAMEALTSKVVLATEDDAA